MGGASLGHSLCGRIAYKQFLPGDADALAAVLRINLAGVGLQPGAVQVELLSPLSRLGDLTGIGYLYNLDDG